MDNKKKFPPHLPLRQAARWYTNNGDFYIFPPSSFSSCSSFLYRRVAKAGEKGQPLMKTKRKEREREEATILFSRTDQWAMFFDDSSPATGTTKRSAPTTKLGTRKTKRKKERRKERLYTIHIHTLAYEFSLFVCVCVHRQKVTLEKPVRQTFSSQKTRPTLATL